MRGEKEKRRRRKGEEEKRREGEKDRRREEERRREGEEERRREEERGRVSLIRLFWRNSSNIIVLLNYQLLMAILVLQRDETNDTFNTTSSHNKTRSPNF